MSFIEKIHNFIRHNRLMDKNKKYLVALSGGADSVSLILALKELGFDVDAATLQLPSAGQGVGA